MYGGDSEIERKVRECLANKSEPGPTWEEEVASYPHNPWEPAARSQAEDMRPGQGVEPYMDIYAPRERQEWRRRVGVMKIGGTEQNPTIATVEEKDIK